MFVHRVFNIFFFLFQPDGANVKVNCADAVSYCGAKDQKYPDRKPMGFPFDRHIYARTKEEMLTSNMAVADVKIKFTGTE